jgi:cupin 2 domain-containing protein
MKAKNLFEGIPAELAEEPFTTVHQDAGLRIERIISQGQFSPEGFWYNQDEVDATLFPLEIS